MTHKVLICGIETSQLPKLKAADCDALIVKIKAGDKQAEEHFVLANARLVLSVVQRFKNKGNSDDLFQVGVIGLLKSVKYFDPKFGVKFSTYAVPMILGEIRRFMRDETSIKVSRRMRDTAYQALRFKEDFEKKHQSSPSIMEIASELHIDVQAVACALDAVSEPISIFEQTGSGEDSMSIMEQLACPNQSENSWIETVSLSSAIENLPERERQVLNLRYYLGKTQIEISQTLDISQAQVSRLEKNALEKLRKVLV